MLTFSETGKGMIYRRMNRMINQGMIMAQTATEENADKIVEKAKKNLERMSRGEEKPNTSLKEGIEKIEQEDGWVVVSKPIGNSMPAAVEFGRSGFTKSASEGALYFRQLGIWRQKSGPQAQKPYLRKAVRDVNFQEPYMQHMATVL